MKIGITARFEVSPHGETWYILEDALVKSLQHARPASNFSLLSPYSDLVQEDLDVLVLTGGDTPGDNPKRDKFEEDLIEYCIKNEIPFLGICRGAQLLAYLEGIVPTRVKGHVGISRELQSNQSYGKCYHNFGLMELSNAWQVMDRDLLDGSIELFKSKFYRAIGVMAHPERHEDSVQILDNLLTELLS